MPESVKILGVKIHNATLQEALREALKIADGHTQNYLTTPNPEILLEAQKNSKFKKILNHSALNIPDGIGLLWAANYQSRLQNKTPLGKITTWLYTLMLSAFIRPTFPLPERVTGTDLMREILKNAPKHKLKIFLLGGKKGIAEKVKNSAIVGTSAASKKETSKTIQQINKSKANVLFVAFGAPHQEIWIRENLKSLKTIKLAIGVGGAFDFLSGKRKRAPKLLQSLGLEWLYRLWQEPSRFKRIFNAVIIFPIAVLKNSLKSSKHK